MKNKPEYIFAGNRYFVLEEMRKLKLNIKKIFAVPGSYLEKELIKNNIYYELLSSKNVLVEYLLKNNFDYFIANGCPYILPILKLESSGSDKKFINIHPSYLPDLRGADPVPAALLFGRDSGATCHVMNDKVDGGDIISQIKIKYSENLDINLLYQLSFWAEKSVFLKAFKRKFKPFTKQLKNNKIIYYSFNENDLKIDFNKTGVEIFRKIRAFGNSNKVARFVHCGVEYLVYDSVLVSDLFTSNFIKNKKENEVVLVYNNSLGIKKKMNLLVLKSIAGDISLIKIGDVLGQK